MQVKTLGLLAAAGMFLSSLTVWSLTTPRSEPPRTAPASPTPGSVAIADTPPPTLASRFAAGSTLMVEGRLGYDRQQAGRDNENYVFIDVVAKKDAVGKATPQNLVIVMDRSGSMRGKRLDNALAAAHGMIERLREGDVISLVSYNTTSEVRVASAEIVGGSRFALHRALDDIVAQGDTCISCGLETASELLRRRSGMVNQMLLLSDGEATAGVKSEAGFRRIAANIQQQGASISTIGVDVDYNEQVMSAIAEEANGRHHFVENAANLSRIFAAELESLANTVADGAELSVSLAPGVRVLEVFDRSYRSVGNRLLVPLGSFSSGAEKTLLLKVSVPPGAVGVKPVADVFLNYQDVISRERGNCEGSLAQTLVANSGELSLLDPLVANRLERSQTARVLLGANDLIKEGKAEQARDLLAKAQVEKRRARRTFAKSPFESATKGNADLEQDFQRQEQVLAEAEASVASGPAGKPVAPSSRKAKAAVRTNQSIARDAAF